jgi:hypothetical protein
LISRRPHHSHLSELIQQGCRGEHLHLRPKAQQSPAQIRGIIDGGMQDRSLLIQLSDVLVGDQRRFVKVEGRSTAEHGLDSNRLSHGVRKLPLLDVTIKVNSLWHDHRHL